MQVKRYLLIFILLLNFVPLSFAQEPRPIVRLIYFLPRDRTAQPDIDEKMDWLIKDVQQSYADQMEAHGFGRKTFLFETDAQGKAVVHRMKGRSGYKVYQANWSVAWNEAFERFRSSNHINFAVFDLGYETVSGGRGGGNGRSGNAYILYNTFREGTAVAVGFTIHELGHAFGLFHDHRVESLGMTTSFCASEWLDAIPAFNTKPISVNQNTTSEMLSVSLAAPPNTLRLRFKVADPDGLQQVQLLKFQKFEPIYASSEPIGNDGSDIGLQGCKGLNGNRSGTIEFVTTAIQPKDKFVRLSSIDKHGNVTRVDFPINIRSVLPRSEVVSIPDANLAAILRQKIGNITTHTMLNLTDLHVRNRGITDLTGIEHAHNLHGLILEGEYIDGNYVNSNAVSDVSLLAGLTGLEYLYLQHNNITDVSPLAGLTGLWYLYLQDNNITDVSALAGLTRLITLSLSGNNITDVAPLTELTQLVTLYLDNNTISNVPPLAELAQLGFLSLRDNSIADVSALAGLTQLETLLLDNNSITDVSALAGLTQLKTLLLDNNSITDVSAFAGLTQLRTLALDNNSITDVSALAGLTQLTQLFLNNNSITDVASLVALNLTGTEWASTGLSLYNNPLSYASINTHIPAMQAKGIEIAFNSRTPTTLAKVSGDTQQSTVNKVLAQPFVVEVRDQRNRAFTGVPVTFTITEGSGKLSTKTATTDTNGNAQARLTLGRTAGITTIRVTAPNIAKPVTFTATAMSLSAPVVFPDANLRAKITETLGKPPGGTLTVTDLLSLTALTAANANIQDLTGLQYAHNLATLSLDNNTISDVSRLATLSQLTTLSLNNNTLSDVEPLTGLTRLKTLQLRGNLLSYPALHTHIPALQASGTTVAFDPRTSTTLLKVSDEEGTAGGAHAIVVEVRDEKGVGFAGVPIAFTVTAGGGYLSTPNAITDAMGRARTTLTLGATPGKNTIRVTAAKGPQPVSFTVTAIDPNTRVTIPDANLQTKILEALSKPRGGQLTMKDMLALTRLVAQNSDIRDLTGLEHARNLQSLDLGGEYIQGEGTLNSNAVSDFSPLQALGQLTTLNLSFNSLSDVSFLSGLTQLRTLYLWNNSITDVAPFAELTQLTQLSLSNNTISDVSQLAELTQLRYLFLSGNSIRDVSPLARLTRLSYLYLDNNAIADVLPLAKLTQLETLWIGSNSITDMSPLAGLTELTQLYLNNNTIMDVSPLAGLTELAQLYLSDNTITDVSPLAKLTELTLLYLDSNSITDVSPLVALNLTGAEWDDTGLSLYNNPLSYASINTHIPALQAKGIVVKFTNRAHPVLLKISGDAQEGFVGNRLSAPFIVEARDARGEPMRGVSVTFASDTGEGTLDPTTTKTDADGKAQTTLTLSWTPGTYTLRATAKGIEAYVQFTVTATVLPNRLATDVNGDGDVDVEDLVLVAASFGTAPAPGTMPDTDVNDDGEVNDADVVLVLAALEGAPAAPPLGAEWAAVSLQRWIDEARQHNSGDAIFQRGIAVLERFLATLLPKEMALLANYPNPFNPETWIPYQLASPAAVTLRIHTVDGSLVRTLSLGHKVVGTYKSRNRAVYWDGKNELGESVASGVYFYTLTAGDFTATRKMLIRK